MKRWKEQLIGHEPTTLINQISRNIINLSLHKILEAKNDSVTHKRNLQWFQFTLEFGIFLHQRTDLITKCGKNNTKKCVTCSANFGPSESLQLCS